MKAVYKCRLCETIGFVKNVDESSIPEIFSSIVLDDAQFTNVYTKTMVYPRVMHNCRDGGVGLADFLGLKPDDESEATGEQLPPVLKNLCSDPEHQSKEEPSVD